APTPGAGLNYSVRLTGDSGGKAGPTVTAVGAAAAASCGAVVAAAPTQDHATTPSWYNLDMCGDSPSTQQSCSVSLLNNQLSGLTAAVFEFPNTAGNLNCPAFADIII